MTEDSKETCPVCGEEEELPYVCNHCKRCICGQCANGFYTVACDDCKEEGKHHDPK